MCVSGVCNTHPTMFLQGVCDMHPTLSVAIKNYEIDL